MCGYQVAYVFLSTIIILRIYIYCICMHRRLINTVENCPTKYVLKSASRQDNQEDELLTLKIA